MRNESWLLDSNEAMDLSEAAEGGRSAEAFPGLHECEFCCLLLPTEVALLEHRKTHTTPDPVHEEDPVVGIAAADVLSSLAHIADPVSVSDKEDYEPAPKVLKKRTRGRTKRAPREPGESLTCHMCGIVFQVHDALAMHQLEHQRQRDAQSTEPESQIDLSDQEAQEESRSEGQPAGTGRRLRQCRALLENDMKSRQCHVCRKIFDTPEELQYHAPVHSEFGPYCISCCKSFRTASTLARHVRELHASQKYECAVCSRCFASVTGLQEHMSKHDPVSCKRKSMDVVPLQPNQCPVCKKIFPSTAELTHHEPVHAECRPYCVSCDKQFTVAAALTRHVCDNQIKRRAVCDVCCSTFVSEKTMREHVVKHNDPSNPVHCKLCTKTFTMQRWMLTHFKHCHGDRDIKGRTNDAADPEDRPACPRVKVKSSHTARYDSSDEEYQERRKTEMTTCSMCDIKFPKKKAAKSSDTCNMCKIQYQRQQEKFECDDCQREFQTAAELDDHKKIHVNPSVYPCPQCYCSFPTENYLIAHIQIHKLLGNKHRCWQCDRTFERSNELKRHMDAVHLKIPHYKCLKCPKTFVHSSDYTRHLRMHSGEKPFQCPICGKKASASNSLQKHMRSEHGADLPLEFLRGTTITTPEKPSTASESSDTDDISHHRDHRVAY